MRNAYVGRVDRAAARALLEEASQQLDAAGGLLAGAEAVQAAVSRIVLLTVLAAALFGTLAGILPVARVRSDGSITPLCHDWPEQMQRLTDRPLTDRRAGTRSAGDPRPAAQPSTASSPRCTTTGNGSCEHGARQYRPLPHAPIPQLADPNPARSQPACRGGAGPRHPVDRRHAALEEATRMEAILDRFVTLYRFPDPEPAELDIALLARQIAGGYPGIRDSRARTFRYWCRPIAPCWTRR